MIPYPFDSSQGEFREEDILKEYTKEELFERYVSENNVDDVIINYVEELEDNTRKMRKGIKELIDYAKQSKDKDYLIKQLQKLLL